MTTGAPTADGGATTPVARVPVALGPARTAPQPPTSGLYDPRFEHDACGVALVADLQGRPSHALVLQAVSALEHLAHRGATGSEEDSGDGAGILIQVPDDFYRAGRRLRPARPRPLRHRHRLPVRRPVGGGQGPRRRSEQLAAEEGLDVLGWRDAPGRAGHARLHRRGGPAVDAPALRGRRPPGTRLSPGDPALAVDRLAFVLRKRAEHEIDDCYFASLSARTVTYKGMLTSHQLAEFYPDLADERLVSGLALVHSRFSTNTFPSWPLAHPYRYMAHNGEINTAGRQPELDAGPRGPVRAPTSSRAWSGPSRS